MFLFRDAALPENKELRVALKKIYGIGWLKAKNIATSLGFKNPYNINNLNYYHIIIVLYLLKGLVLSETKINRVIENNITKLITISSYKGARHLMNLPVHGQRTRTNAGTQRRKRQIKK